MWPHPWDSPGKNTGVGCHFLPQCIKVKSEIEVAQSCPTLRDPMDCSLPGSSTHGVFQARVLEWGAIAFSGQGPSKRHNPEIWAASLHRVWQWASFCVWDIQTLSRSLGMKWKLHTAYTPQSSGKVEQVNWTLKTTLVKLCQETNLSWSHWSHYPSLTLSPMHPEVLGLFSLWDLIRDHPQW